MVHDVVDIIIYILDIPLGWILIRVVSFCSRVVNAVVPQDFMPCFYGMHFTVVICE